MEGFILVETNISMLIGQAFKYKQVAFQNQKKPHQNLNVVLNWCCFDALNVSHLKVTASMAGLCVCFGKCWVFGVCQYL